MTSAQKVPSLAPKLVFPRPSSLTWQEQETFLYKQRMVKLDNIIEDRWTFYKNFNELLVEE